MAVGNCVECDGEGKYKCPKCRVVKYCSVKCNKAHQEKCAGMDASTSKPASSTPNLVPPAPKPKIPFNLPSEKLELLRSPAIRDLLKNEDLRSTLLQINSVAADTKSILETSLLTDQKFKAFAEECLTMVVDECDKEEGEADPNSSIESDKLPPDTDPLSIITELMSKNADDGDDGDGDED